MGYSDICACIRLRMILVEMMGMQAKVGRK